MTRGGARAGAGRRPKPLSDHVMAGTYRPDRHGPMPATVLPTRPRRRAGVRVRPMSRCWDRVRNCGWPRPWPSTSLTSSTG